MRVPLRTEGLGNKNPRTDLLSQDAAIQVPLALPRFTTLFGMGRGGATALWARGCL